MEDFRLLRRLIRETLAKMGELPMTTDDDPMLASWDIIRDLDFYEGLPASELEQALEHLYLMRDSPPAYADVEEIDGVIEHVEGLLGFNLGEETIDIPLG